jgi:hypothetical protein
MLWHKDVAMPTPILMVVYVAFLATCGVVAFAMSGFASNARTSLIVGFGTAAVMVTCGWLASMIKRNKAAGMIGIHVGLILPLIFAGLFGWRAYKAYADPSGGKLYLATILSIMALGSILAFGLLLSARPKVEMRG